MRHDDVADAGLDRGVHEREHLMPAHVPGGHHDVVRGDHREHGTDLGEHGAVVVEHRDGLDRDALAAQLGLELGPDGQVRAGAGRRQVLALVRRVHGRHPHRPGALAGGQLDRERVDPADGAIQHDRAEHVIPGTTPRTTAARSAVDV